MARSAADRLHNLPGDMARLPSKGLSCIPKTIPHAAKGYMKVPILLAPLSHPHRQSSITCLPCQLSCLGVTQGLLSQVCAVVKRCTCAVWGYVCSGRCRLLPRGMFNPSCMLSRVLSQLWPWCSRIGAALLLHHLSLPCSCSCAHSHRIEAVLVRKSVRLSVPDK